MDGGTGRNLSSVGTREVLLSFGRWRDRRRLQRRFARQTASTRGSRLELYESVMRAVSEWNEPFIITFKSKEKPEFLFQFAVKGQSPAGALANRPAAGASEHGRRALDHLGFALQDSTLQWEQYVNDQINFEIASMAKLVEDVFIEAFGCSDSYSGQVSEDS